MSPKKETGACRSLGAAVSTRAPRGGTAGVASSPRSHQHTLSLQEARSRLQPAGPPAGPSSPDSGATCLFSHLIGLSALTVTVVTECAFPPHMVSSLPRNEARLNARKRGRKGGGTPRRSRGAGEEKWVQRGRGGRGDECRPGGRPRGAETEAGEGSGRDNSTPILLRGLHPRLFCSVKAPAWRRRVPSLTSWAGSAAKTGAHAAPTQTQAPPDVTRSPGGGPPAP